MTSSNPVIGIIIKRKNHYLFLWKRISIEYLRLALIAEHVREAGLDPIMGSITTSKGRAYKIKAYHAKTNGYILERK